jgi:hypothetical protein
MGHMPVPARRQWCSLAAFRNHDAISAANPFLLMDTAIQVHSALGSELMGPVSFRMPSVFAAKIMASQID